ncbi:hypothetical protein D9M68_247780 [compost metagenome]
MLLPEVSTSVPVPALIRLPLPPIAPETVTVASISRVAAPPRLKALSMVPAPVTCRVLSAASATVPAPRLPSPATTRVPAETLVVPE